MCSNLWGDSAPTRSWGIYDDEHDAGCVGRVECDHWCA